MVTNVLRRGAAAVAVVSATLGCLAFVTGSARAQPGNNFIVHVGPVNATVVLQLTTDHYQTGSGFTAVYECAVGWQGTSSLNNSGPVASNLVIAKTDANGDVCVRSMQPTDVIVDLAGTLSTAAILAPKRKLDTRFGPCPDGQHAISWYDSSHDGIMQLNEVVCDSVSDGLPTAKSATTDFIVPVGNPNSAVVLQITTSDYANGVGWTSVYPCAAGYQGTSSLNNNGPVASNLVIAHTDPQGNICVKSQQPTDLIVDSAGTLSGVDVSHAGRVVDTRIDPCGSGSQATHWVDSNTDGIQQLDEVSCVWDAYVVPWAVSSSVRLEISPNIGIPNATVILQLTTDDYESGLGWTAIYNCADGYKGTSSLNNTGHPVASNLVIVNTGADGRVCIKSLQNAHFIVDIIGTLAGATIHSPTRVLDTRG